MGDPRRSPCDLGCVESQKWWPAPSGELPVAQREGGSRDFTRSSAKNTPSRFATSPTCLLRGKLLREFNLDENGQLLRESRLGATAQPEIQYLHYNCQYFEIGFATRTRIRDGGGVGTGVTTGRPQCRRTESTRLPPSRAAIRPPPTCRHRRAASRRSHRKTGESTGIRQRSHTLPPFLLAPRERGGAGRRAPPPPARAAAPRSWPRCAVPCSQASGCDLERCSSLECRARQVREPCCA